ncbi:MAG: DUF3006 domain-containing protein [Gemmatimonadaceae bacterium]
MPKHTPQHTSPPNPPVVPPAVASAHTGDSCHSGDQVWVIDTIEQGTASVEVDGRGGVNVPAWVLPRDAHEGDVFRVTIAHDAAEQTRRLERSQQQVEQLAVKSKADPGGDIAL